jgi:hypothetical protein
LHSVELAVVVERLSRREFATQHPHQLRGPRVPTVVISEVIVPLLVKLFAAGNVVDGHPTDLIK